MIYGYIRVSTEKQTVEVQRYEINRYCVENGLTVDAWIEESISGATKPSARLLGRLILDRIGKGDLILVTEISRLGRNVYMVMSIINHCMLCGAEILPIWKGEVIKEDSMSVYETFFDIISAQKEREMISRRTKCALAMIKSNGIKLGRPIGIPRQRKLEGRDDDIKNYLKQGISKAEISRKLGVNPSTLNEYIRIKGIKKMNNEFILNLENQFHGINTRLKELHYSAPTMSIHKLIDEFYDEFQEFDDAIMENSQALWGFIKPGELNPILPEALEFEDLLADIRGILVSVKKEANDDLMWTGIINRVDDFFETVNRYIYLIKICKHQSANGN